MNGVKEKEHYEVAKHSEEQHYEQPKNKKNKKIIIIGICVFIVIAIIATIFILQYCGSPIVKMNGEERIELEYGSTYVDEGVEAYTKFKSIKDKVIVENNVDTSKVGTYNVVYKVPNKGKFDVYTRTVEVKDTKLPEITITGEEECSVEYGKEFEEPGYEAVDEYDGNITEKVIVSKEEKENGNYDIRYSVEDSSGNKTEKIRHIKIVDTIAPKIKLNGSSFISLVKDSKYVEQGATATDNKDGDLSSKIKIEGNNFDTSVEGKYVITYKVSDYNGNEASATRTVMVGDSAVTGVIYLTFDDGPSTTSTPKILDILKEKGVHATFFVINYNEGTEAILKREIDEGNAVGIHGYSHDYSKAYASVEACYENIVKLQQKIEKSTGIKTMLLRFPGGSSNTVSRKYCAGVMTKISEKVLAEGFKYYDWNVASGDSGDVKTKEGVYNNVTKGLKPGRNNVVLMHDFSGNNKTVEALPDIIDYGLSNGYKFEVLTIDVEMVTQKIQN